MIAWIICIRLRVEFLVKAWFFFFSLSLSLPPPHPLLAFWCSLTLHFTCCSSICTVFAILYSQRKTGQFLYVHVPCICDICESFLSCHYYICCHLYILICYFIIYYFMQCSENVSPHSWSVNKWIIFTTSSKNPHLIQSAFLLCFLEGCCSCLFWLQTDRHHLL